MYLLSTFAAYRSHLVTSVRAGHGLTSSRMEIPVQSQRAEVGIQSDQWIAYNHCTPGPRQLLLIPARRPRVTSVGTCSPHMGAPLTPTYVTLLHQTEVGLT